MIEPETPITCPYSQCQAPQEKPKRMSSQAKSCQFEVKLRESEELFRLILTNISDTVLITDEAGAFTYICPNIEFIFGYSSQEAQEFGNISNLLGEDFLESDELRNSSELCNIEWTITDKVGRNHTVLINVKRVEIQGGTRLYSCRDITERKIAQEALRQAHEELEKRVEERTVQLSESNALLRAELIERKRTEEALRQSEATNRALVNAIPDLMFRLKTDGTFVDFKASKDFNLLVPPSEFLGIKVQDVMPPEIADKTTQAIAHALLTSQMQVFEYQLVFNNTPRHYEARIVVSQKDEVLVLVRDITSRQQAEEALRRSQAELQQANEKLICWVDELEQRNQEMALLGKMSDFLQTCVTVEDAYSALSRLVQPIFLGSAGGVFLLDTTQNRLEAVATWGTSLTSAITFSLRECWALRRRRSRFVPYNHSNLRCQHIHAYPPAGEFLCVPMMVEGTVLGLLYLSSLERGRLSEAKQKLAVTVAEHLTLAISNLKLRETLKHESIHDPLTGLFNRRYMEESLKREIYRARRQGQPVGVIMIDIDHFKQFNDSFGHEAGDRVLQELASFLQSNIRSSDIACRYGGEELLLILPDADLAVTRQRAEHLREGVKHLQVPYHHQTLDTITISLGVACFPEQGLTGETVIQAADRALYQAKRLGRDRVAVADPSALAASRSTLPNPSFSQDRRR